MNSEIMSIVVRVVVCCCAFAYFVAESMKSRLRYGKLETGLLMSLLLLLTAMLTIFFLVPDQYLSDYNGIAILAWIISGIFIFRSMIKGSVLEILFLILVILNLYVNIAGIAKIIVVNLKLMKSEGWLYAGVTIGVLILYIPLLWVLFIKLYKKVIEFDIRLSFWKFIWIIPALTYMIFYVKIVNDYWRNPVKSSAEEVVFMILWSFTTYSFFCVILQMLVQAYNGIAAKQQMRTIETQLDMQEKQYKRLLNYIEYTARQKHDWRHHLLLINGFAEKGELQNLQDYIKKLLPEYTATGEVQICQNHIIDVIIRHYVAQAKTLGIDMRCKMDLPDQIGVSETDLCIIFGNLVENAVEACSVQDSREKSIMIKSYMKERQLVLIIKNTYNREVIRNNGVFCSTKHDGDGIGIASVKQIAEKYYGIIKTEYDGNYFSVYILLSTKEEQTV